MFKILILEDDLILLKTLKDVLCKNHYQVDLAHDLNRAEQLIADNDYDLLIFDRLVNNEDSLEFLEALRADQTFIRVLIISQKKLIDDRLLSLKVADDFLAKPFVIKELLLKVNNLLSRSKYKLEENGDFQLKTFALFALSTMARVNALSNVMWKQIDFEKILSFVRKTI